MWTRKNRLRPFKDRKTRAHQKYLAHKVVLPTATVQTRRYLLSDEINCLEGMHLSVRLFHLRVLSNLLIGQVRTILWLDSTGSSVRITTQTWTSYVRNCSLSLPTVESSSSGRYSDGSGQCTGESVFNTMFLALVNSLMPWFVDVNSFKFAKFLSLWLV